MLIEYRNGKDPPLAAMEIEPLFVPLHKTLFLVMLSIDNGEGWLILIFWLAMQPLEPLTFIEKLPAARFGKKLLA